MLARRRGDGAARGDRIGMLFAVVHESVGGPSPTSVVDALKSAHEGRPVVMCVEAQGRVCPTRSSRAVRRPS
jgi:hypothetical protein